MLTTPLPSPGFGQEGAAEPEPLTRSCTGGSWLGMGSGEGAGAEIHRSRARKDHPHLELTPHRQSLSLHSGHRQLRGFSRSDAHIDTSLSWSCAELPAWLGALDHLGNRTCRSEKPGMGRAGRDPQDHECSCCPCTDTPASPPLASLLSKHSRGSGSLLPIPWELFQCFFHLLGEGSSLIPPLCEPTLPLLPHSPQSCSPELPLGWTRLQEKPPNPLLNFYQTMQRAAKITLKFNEPGLLASPKKHITVKVWLRKGA